MPNRSAARGICTEMRCSSGVDLMVSETEARDCMDAVKEPAALLKEPHADSYLPPIGRIRRDIAAQRLQRFSILGMKTTGTMLIKISIHSNCAFLERSFMQCIKDRKSGVRMS